MSLRRSAIVVFFFAVVAVLGSSPAPAVAATCESLAALKLPHSTVTFAGPVTGGSFTPPGAQPITNLPAFCRIAVTVRPSYDSDIKVEVWMPLQGWNGRYLGTGNGGYAGAIQYGGEGLPPRLGLASGLRLGYAVANTDMGTAPPSGRGGAEHLIGHPERWIDFGYRSTHEMTVIAKEIIQTFYGEPPRYCYFSGCSSGGMQALREAQLFPVDYDGILAGAPGINRARQHISIMWNHAIAAKNPASALPHR